MSGDRCWRLPGFPGGCRKLTLAGTAIAPKVSFLALPRTHTRGRERTTGHGIAVPDIYTDRRPVVGPSARNCWLASTHCTAPVAPTIAYFSFGANTLGFVIHVNGEMLDANPTIVQGFMRATQK